MVPYHNEDIDIGTGHWPYLASVFIVLVYVYLSLYSVSMHLCIHQPSQHAKWFHHHKCPSCCLSINAPASPWQHTPCLTPNLFFPSNILSFYACYIKRIIQYVTFWGWLFSPSIIPWRSIQFFCVSFTPFYIFLGSMGGCITVSLITHPSKDAWVVFHVCLLQI